MLDTISSVDENIKLSPPFLTVRRCIFVALLKRKAVTSARWSRRCGCDAKKKQRGTRRRIEGRMRSARETQPPLRAVSRRSGLPRDLAVPLGTNLKQLCLSNSAGLPLPPVYAAPLCQEAKQAQQPKTGLISRENMLRASG